MESKPDTQPPKEGANDENIMVREEKKTDEDIAKE
jgi:hypothetical protein